MSPLSSLLIGSQKEGIKSLHLIFTEGRLLRTLNRLDIYWQDWIGLEH